MKPCCANLDKGKGSQIGPAQRDLLCSTAAVNRVPSSLANAALTQAGRRTSTSCSIEVFISGLLEICCIAWPGRCCALCVEQTCGLMAAKNVYVAPIAAIYAAIYLSHLMQLHPPSPSLKDDLSHTQQTVHTTAALAT